MKLPVYLDYQATTPVDERVFDKMIPYFIEKFGNASSTSHIYGEIAGEAVEKAREQVANLINAQAKEIVFTSGATSSDNLAIKGAAEIYKEKGNHIITCKTEHKAVIDTCKYLAENGYDITWLEPDIKGHIDLNELENAITDKTILISLMGANNEIGVLHPLKEIGAIAKKRGVLFHCDAAQAIGKIPIDVIDMNIDMLSISAHKIYGPKGIGALYVRSKNPRVVLAPNIHGGGHERGMRSGTLNVPGIVGFGEACEICKNEMTEENERILKLRTKLYNGIMSQLDEVYLNGDLEKRLPGNLNISFAYIEGESLMLRLKDDIAVSSGSACTSATLEPSYVLKAIGIQEELAHTSIRFGIGRFTTEEEIDHAIKKIVAQTKELRELSPLYDMAKEGIDLKKVKWAEH